MPHWRTCKEMAAAVVAEPVGLPTTHGGREQFDLAATVLNLQKLEDPQVSVQHCSERYGPQVLRSIFEKLQERSMEPAFEVLNLSDNNIGNEGAKYLEEGLRGNKTLKRLLLPRTGLGPEGFASVGTLLAGNTSVEALVVSGNNADPAGAEGIAKGLQSNKALRSVTISACRIGSLGAQSVARALTAHPQLEHLALAYNRIESPAMPAIKNLLNTSQSLRFLDLGGNSIGPDGAVQLADALKKAKITKLSVSTNGIELKGAKALVTHFASAEGKAIEYLDLRHNLVTYRGVVELREFLKKPMGDDSDLGWMMLFEGRQLLLNAH